MRTHRLVLAALILAAAAGTVAAFAAETGPRHKAVVACFNNVKDESQSLCSVTCYSVHDGSFPTDGRALPK